MPSLAELRERYAERVAPLGACTCGVDREPGRRTFGALSVLVCDRCGRRCLERKYPRCKSA